LIYQQGLDRYDLFRDTLNRETPSYKERVANSTAAMSKYILSEWPDNTLGDDLTLFLKACYDKSETYHCDPRLIIAFAAVESNFIVKAKSPAGAKGLLQFMPPTAKELLGSSYSPDCEFNPLTAVDLWYRHYLSCRDYFQGDTETVIGWVAAYYLAGPDACKAYNSAVTWEDFLSSRQSKWTDPLYPQKIITVYNKLRGL
jgi:hypothetical protein